jgi:hypothetical protein
MGREDRWRVPCLGAMAGDGPLCPTASGVEVRFFARTIARLNFHLSFSSELTWSQCEDAITLHALPTTHCTNVIEATGGGVYHTEMGAFDYPGALEDVGGEDFDYAMDCGDFIF